MKIWRIHSIKLQGVSIAPKECDCFLHDYELLGVTLKEIVDDLEGQRMLIYTGDFSRDTNLRNCPWCKQKVDNPTTHCKSSALSVKVLKFQIELYREKLRLLRTGEIDHSYFVYTNWLCQHCVDKTTRGRGLCSIPESARNKVRSLRVMGFKASNFISSLLKKPNIGYIIGKGM
jgi:hypothetical protein